MVGVVLAAGLLEGMLPGTVEITKPSFRILLLEGRAAFLIAHERINENDAGVDADNILNRPRLI